LSCESVKAKREEMLEGPNIGKKAPRSKKKMG